MRPVRWVAGARLIWAVLLLSRPRIVLRVALAPRERNSPRARAVVRLLGVRNLAQSLVELVHPSPLVLTGAAAVDALHALSFLAFAAARPDRRWRRAVLLNVGSAAAFCAATMVSRRPLTASSAIPGDDRGGNGDGGEDAAAARQPGPATERGVW